MENKNSKPFWLQGSEKDFPISPKAIEHCKREIGAGLKALGIREGDTLLMHTSFKSFGYIEGGVQTLINALKLVVGESGNLIVPTLTGSEKLSPENPPIFDVMNTPCWTGYFPESFRKQRTAKRSLHPTHSVAVIGPDAQDLIKDHEISPTPCGAETPYYRLAAKGGKVVCFGVGFECVTLFHTVEELAMVPYHLQPEPVEAQIIDYLGNKKTVKIFIHKYGDERNFSAMEPFLEREGGVRTDKVLRSVTKLIDAKMLIELTLEKLKQNPRFLLK